MSATERALLFRARTNKREHYKRTMTYKLKACADLLLAMDDLDDHAEHCRVCKKRAYCREADRLIDQVNVVKSAAYAAIVTMDFPEDDR